MTAYTWIGGTGDWELASNWRPSSPAGPPKATDTATVSAPGSAYTVTIDTTDVAKSLTENSASATVDDTGSLTLSGTFTLSAGTFILGQGGTLSGGTTKIAGGTVVCEGGTLSGVTYDGTLNLSGSGASVHLANGTMVNNAAGDGAGTINDTGTFSHLYFDNTQTFNNATINLGNATNSFLNENDLTGAGAVLTLGSKVTINASRFARIYVGGTAGDGIVDQGKINQTARGGYLEIYGNSFTNRGTITAASSGGALLIDPTTFTNSGTLAVSNGEAVTIDAKNFGNTGSIRLASSASLYLDVSFTVAGLGTLSNSGGTVYIQRKLDNTGGTLNASSSLGQAVLYGGTVQGGTVTPAGLVFSSSGGTLSSVTYDGTLDLSGRLGVGAAVHLANGTVLQDAAGTEGATINDTGPYSSLYFDNTQTFNNGTINLGSTPDYNYLYEYDSTGAGTVLTLGSKVTINESGGAYIHAGNYAGDGIVDQGNINQTASGVIFTFLTIYGNSFTNSGTITAASSGGMLTIDPTTFTNSGTLAVSNGDAVTFEPTHFSNTGSITLASGASLYLDTSFTLAGLGKLNNSGGTVYIQGTFDNTGGTLNGSSSLGQAVLYGGVVQGGTVAPAGLVLSNYGGTLSGVTYDGTLNISGSRASVHLANGTVVNNAAGTGAGAGTINDSGEYSYLYFDNAQTFNNATIDLGNTSGYYSYLYEYDSTRAGTVLTLGSGVAIEESGDAQIYTGEYSGDGIVDQGTISQTASGGTLSITGNSFTNSGTITASSSGGSLTIEPTTFTNSGAIDISNGDTVTTEPKTFTNLSGTTLTGGAYRVGAGSVLELPNNATIATDDANITLSLAGSLIQSLNTTTSAQQSFDSTLRTIGASGQLHLLAGRSLTTAAAAITDNGLIQLGGGALKITGTGSSLTIGAAGKLEGFGVVDATTLTNSGLIEASGGTLTVQSAITGTGGLQIKAGATLSLTGTASLSGTTSGAGTLALAGGTATIDSGATVTASTWMISGAGTDVTLGENLTYTGSFSEAAGDTFVLSGGNLLLNGADTLSGGTVDGSKLLETEGTTTVSGLTIGGTVEWENTKSVTQSGGTVTVGDSSGDKAFLDNTSTGTYDIAGAGAIGRGGSTASDIKNAGLFEKTGGTGTSTIAPAVTNTGTIKVSSGTLDFKGAVSGKGTDTISGASTLEFGAGVSSAATLGYQDIGLTGGGTLHLLAPTSFYGEISDFEAGDTVELLGSWAFSGFSENSGGTLATLTLANGATTHAFEFVGNYAQGDFKITSGATSTITHT